MFSWLKKKDKPAPRQLNILELHNDVMKRIDEMKTMLKKLDIKITAHDNHIKTCDNHVEACHYSIKECLKYVYQIRGAHLDYPRHLVEEILKRSQSEWIYILMTSDYGRRIESIDCKLEKIVGALNVKL